MDTRQLQYFVSLAKTLNFTQSAEEFYITQPALSRQIYELENEVGAILLFRSKRNVSLTRAGEEFYKYAIEILERMETGSNAIRAIANGVTGKIAISTTPSQQSLVKEVIQRFSEQFPSIQLFLSVDTREGQISSINQKKNDVYFSFYSLLKNHTSIKSHIVTKEKFFVYLPEKNVMSTSDKDQTALKSIPFITVSQQNAPYLSVLVQEVFKRKGFGLNEKIIYAPNLESVILSVKSGLGYTILPETLHNNYNLNNVAAFPLDGDDASIKNAVGWDPSGTNNAIPLLLGCIKEIYPEFDYS